MALTRTEKKFEKLIAMAVSGTSPTEVNAAKRSAKKLATEQGFDFEQEMKCYRKFSTIDRQRISIIQLENGTAFDIPPLSVPNSKNECEALRTQLDAALKEIESLKRKLRRYTPKTVSVKSSKPRRAPKKKSPLLIPFLTK